MRSWEELRDTTNEKPPAGFFTKAEWAEAWEAPNTTTKDRLLRLVKAGVMECMELKRLGRKTAFYGSKA
jgi:hypothetical protein